jgi:hypothetical protein
MCANLSAIPLEVLVVMEMHVIRSSVMLDSICDYKAVYLIVIQMLSIGSFPYCLVLKAPVKELVRCTRFHQLLRAEIASYL